MTGDGILDGDLLVVERALYFPPGSHVLAFADGQRIVRRLVQRGPDFYLCSPSPEHCDIELTDAVELWGVVICSITVFPRAKANVDTAI
jgi:DNA polymerase V